MSETKSTELVVQHKGTALTAFEPGSLQELIQLSEVMARSGLVPDDYRGKAANIVVAVMSGRDIGLSASQSLQSICVINGRATLWGDAVLGIVRQSGKLEYIREFFEGDDRMASDYAAVCVVKRVDEDEERIQRFTIQMAADAGLLTKKGPWQDYRDRMLKLRARSWLLRDTFGDILKGLSVREEIEDIQDEPRNVTPTTTGNESLRQQLADRLGASGVAKTPAEPQSAATEPAPVVEGIVEEPLPDFSKMLSEQIKDELEQLAQDRQMDEATYREIVKTTLESLKGDAPKVPSLNRTTAPAVYKALKAWVKPEAPPAQETLIP